MRLDEFYNPNDDKWAYRNADDTRKPKLTLELIGKLRRYRTIKQAEDLEHAELASRMYATPAADAGGI